MKLSIGIVGLPNVGKSTLFKAITKQQVNIANYPFATIDPNVGVVVVPDERLEKLAKLSNSKKIVPAVVEFYDIAGLVKGAYKGEGLGNKFLSYIRDVNAIVQVVRCFPSSEIIHVEQGVDPIRDLEIINMELVLKDLDTAERRLKKLEDEAKTDKQKQRDFEIAKLLQKGLNENKLAIEILRESALNQRESAFVEEMNFLTAKKQIYLLNGKAEDVSEELKNKIKSLNADYLIVDLGSENNEIGISELIKKAYEVLNLISFLTTGEDETRAWTIEKGAKAPQAAGVIHTDFEKNFIRAEAINWQKLMETGGWNEARQKGWLRLEGKEYIVQDGDVIVVRHAP